MKVNIVGWSGINHSYSIVAEAYVKGIINNCAPEDKFYFTPYKYYNESWKKTKLSLFDNLPLPKEQVDLTIRFVYPYDLAPDPNAKCTLVFMTCEFNYLSDIVDTQNICDNVLILTPSEYSKTGLVSSGINPDKIIVIPHCYDYEKVKLTKQELRIKYDIPQEDYVYFHNSSLTANKNCMTILNCFEQLYTSNKNITLFIKGIDSSYNSHDKLIELIQMLELQLKHSLMCRDKIIYVGTDVSDATLSEYYELSDCYLSPFLAEGFNMPVLEALCHGTRVICTRGGPPDEFAESNTFFIDSVIRDTDENMFVSGREKHKKCLYPDSDNLFKLMKIIPTIELTSDEKDAKKNYSSKYSSKMIGKIFYDRIKEIIKHNYVIPTILTVYDKNISLIIENIRFWCPNDNIYVCINNEEQKQELIKLGFTKEKHYEYLKIENLSHIEDKIESIVKENTFENLILVKNILLFADPRAIFINNCHNINIFYHDKYTNNLLLGCMRRNIHRRTIRDVSFSEIDNDKTIKEYLRKDRLRLLYRTEDYKVEQILMQENKTNISIKNIIIKPEDTKMTLEKFLRKVDIAIITTSIFKKYESVFRSAPLTILFDAGKDQIAEEECENLNKSKIFVYPESLEYFFNVVFKFIKNKFTLYTIECDFTSDKKYLEFDKNNKIIECICFKS